MSASYDAIVVGGGIVGATIAHALQLNGYRTVLVEKDDLGGAVTGASLACIGAHMISREEMPALIWSCRTWSELDAQTGHRMEYDACGQLRFVTNEAELQVAEDWIAFERGHGLPTAWLEPEELNDIEPELTGPVLGATWSPGDVTINPFLAVRAIVADGIRQGLDVRTHAPVDRVVDTNGHVTGVRLADGTDIGAGLVVVAAGPWTGRLARSVGLDLPIVSRRAQCLATVAMPPTIRRVVGACESCGGVEAGYTQIQQARRGQVLFNTVFGGGQGDDAGQDRIPEVDPAFVRNSIDMLLWLFPSLASATLLRSWVRYEAVTPDERFIAGSAGPEGLWFAAGDAGTGFIRAPALARLIVDGIAERSPPFDASLYAPDRFDARQAA